MAHRNTHRRAVGHRSHRHLRLEPLEPRWLLAGDTFLINFQLAGAPVPTRYAADTGELYGDRGGGLFYGWSSDHTDVSRDRGLQADQRLDTLIHFHQNQNWEFALPNGTYAVTISIGDAENASTHTLNVEGVNYWNAVALTPNNFLTATQQITVSDGRLTLDQGAAIDKATRIDFIQVVGLPNGPNTAPAIPTVTQPVVDGQIVNPSDVHMEAVGFFDDDGDLHLSSDWEIWTVGSGTAIYSDANDGYLEVRDTLPPTSPWPAIHPDTFGHWNANVGEWFGPGLTTIVLPFELPNFGAVANPFLTADFGVNLFEMGTATVTDIDLYAVRVDANPAIAVTDWYNGASPDGGATMIQASFLTPASTVGGPGPNNNTDAGGDAALLSYMNTAYAGGAGAGDFVFLRLSYASDTFAAGWDAYKITVREAGGGTPDYPVLSYTTNIVPGDAELVWQTLGITGVERLHTHLGDGVFINSHAGRTDLEANTDYELRVRFRDDEGSVSGYATRTFQTADASTIFPLELLDVRDVPSPQWLGTVGGSVVLPSAAPNQSELRLESAGGDLLLSIAGGGSPHVITNPAPLADHADLRIVVTAGSDGLNLGQTTLDFRDDDGQDHTVYLPAINLAANQRLDLWVSSEGSTYYGTAAQTEPDFSDPARRAVLPVPFLAMEPGFVVEEVAGGFQLPVNIAFVPNPGPSPGDPLFYVNELYGTIKVVTNDLTVSDYATGLLNFDPTGAFPGSGEQGLAGLVVDPATGDLFVTRVVDTDGLPGGVHHPQVVRLSSSDGGLTASNVTVIRDMVGENQGQSHQISNVSIGPDGKLYVHMGDGFDYTTAQNLDSYRGKILRLNLDGSAPTDNPFYNAPGGINARDYVYAYGVRNPFGGAWRESDGKHYEVENGPSVDRFAQINAGVNYGWNNTDASMTINAIYNWDPAHAPVNITFVQPGTFDGSQFPAELMDRAYVSESGPTYALGPQVQGKRLVEFELDASGDLVSGPNTFVEYVGVGRASVVGLTAGPDGLYFTELYKDLDPSSPIEAGARVIRVRYVNPLAGDYDIDGDVDEDDFLVWRGNFGSTYLLAADGNGNGVIDAADYTVWRDALESFPGLGAGAATVAAISGEVNSPREDSHSLAMEEIVTDNAANLAGVAPPTGTSVVYAKTRPRATFDRVTPASSTSQRDNLLTAWLATRADKHDRRDGPEGRPVDQSDVGETDNSPHCGIDAVFGLWGADRWHRGLF